MSTSFSEEKLGKRPTFSGEKVGKKTLDILSRLFAEAKQTFVFWPFAEERTLIVFQLKQQSRAF